MHQKVGAILVFVLLQRKCHSSRCSVRFNANENKYRTSRFIDCDARTRKFIFINWSSALRTTHSANINKRLLHFLATLRFTRQPYNICFWHQSRPTHQFSHTPNENKKRWTKTICLAQWLWQRDEWQTFPLIQNANSIFTVYMPDFIGFTLVVMISVFRRNNKFSFVSFDLL